MSRMSHGKAAMPDGAAPSIENGDSAKSPLDADAMKLAGGYIHILPIDVRGKLP